MPVPTTDTLFEGAHRGTFNPADPNLFSLADIAAAIGTDSLAISVTTSKAVSTVNAAAPDSASISTATSKATSSGTQASGADSKAVSGSLNTSTVDSKATSGSVNTSVADSKATSIATALIIPAVNNLPGFQQPFATASIRTANSKMAETVSGGDFAATANGVLDDRQALELANATGPFVLTPGSYRVGSDLTISSACAPQQGARLKPDGGATITITGPFVAGLYRVFEGAGSIVFGQGAVAEARPEWWGFSPSAAPAVNASALQAAIGSGAQRIVLPNGAFNCDTGITIDRAIEIVGGGATSGPSFTQAGTSTTVLTFAGSGVAIALLNTSGEGVEQIHLAKFEMVGTSAASGGILFGSLANTTYIMHSSVTDVVVKSFSSGYGLRFQRALVNRITNVVSRGNQDGFLSDTGDVTTTNIFTNCRGYTSTRNGTRWIGDSVSDRFIGHINESNDQEGLVLNRANAPVFLSYHSEDNCRVSGSAPVAISGASGAPTFTAHFIGGFIGDPVGGCNVTLDWADTVVFDNVRFSSSVSGFVTCTANTTGCRIMLREPLPPSYVTGNALGRVLVQGGSVAPGRYAVAGLDHSTETVLPFTSGVLAITAKSQGTAAKHFTGMVSLNGGAHTTSIHSDPQATFVAISSPADDQIGVYWDSGSYRILHKIKSAGVYLDDVDFIVTVLNPDAI